MKRTNLVLDEDLLNETFRISGAKTYSAAVSAAMTEYVRIKRFNRIFELEGTGVWTGNLSKMRQDRISRKR